MTPGEAIAAEIPRLRRYARALLGDRAAADDLVQDCLERALARAEGWREGDSPRNWLFTILHNLHVDNVRRSGRRPRHVALEAADREPDGASDDPSVAMDIGAALQRLSDEQRQAVLMVGLEGLSYAQTAEVLGVPIGTVMSRLARGRERLRQLLSDEPGRKPHLTRVK